MTPEERRKFLETRRLAVAGLEREDGPPHLSPVYYVLDGEDILISTTSSRIKAKLVRKRGRMSLCVLGEQQPFPYLTVTGSARIEDEGAPQLMARIGEVMTGRPVPEAALPALEERAKNEGRVVLRLTPETFYP